VDTPTKTQVDGPPEAVVN